MPMIPDQQPAALVAARGALNGLAAMLNAMDDRTWNSLARPSASDLAQLVWAIGGKLDQAVDDLGFEA